MNFIKVHNHIDEAVLINAEAIQTIYPSHSEDFPTANAVIILSDDGRMSNRVTETVDELAAMLLPGPVAKELSPGVQERRSALLIIREFLKIMREAVKAECDKHGICEACRHSRSEFLCGFRNLEDDEINAIIAEYNSEGQEAANG